MNKKLVKILVLAIILLAIITGVTTFMLNKNTNNEKEDENKTKIQNKEKDKWFIPNGEANKIDVYVNKFDGRPEFEDSGVDFGESLSLYEIINTYKCNLSSCKTYGYDLDNKEVIIKDDYYVIYNYEKGRAKKLELPDAEYNDIQILSYEGKVYGLSISNINNLYSFYSLTKKEFTTDFSYSNIFVSEKAGLKENNISVAIPHENFNYKYAIVSFGGDIRKESTAYLGSIGNKEKVYYYENYAEMDGYDAIVLDNNFKDLFDGRRYQDFGVTNSGNLIVKNEENDTFSIYNSKGKLVKTSKEYKNINLILNDYIVVTDKDNYLKIVNEDGNVKFKFDEVNNDLVIDRKLSGIYKENGNNIMYLFDAKTYDYDAEDTFKYYYNLRTKENGVIKSSEIS